MAYQYWISNVGGEEWVGRRYHRHHHSGQEYLTVMPPVSFVYDSGYLATTSDDDMSEYRNVVSGFWDDINPVNVVKTVTRAIVHTVNNAAKVAGKAVHTVEKAVNSIPVIGPAIADVIKLDPTVALGGLVSKVAHGERLDKAFLSTGKDVLKATKELAPYVQTVVSFVPGVGTGVAAAIAAGTALAEGRTITDAMVEGVKGSVPGGKLGQTAFTAAMNIAHGQRLDKAALDAAKAQLPPAVASGIDVAMKAAKGDNVKDAVLQAIRKQLPSDAQKALDVGVALAAGRNIQSAVINSVIKPAVMTQLATLGSKALAAAPQSIGTAVRGLSKDGTAGYKTALGLLSTRGVNAHTIVALRGKLNKEAQHGFDHALNTYNQHFYSWPAVVSNGLVMRGDWRSAAANAKGAVKGKIVQDGKVKAGHFVRAS